LALQAIAAAAQTYVEITTANRPLVLPGATYRLSAWVVRRFNQSGSNTPMTMRADAYLGGTAVATSVISLQTSVAVGTWTYLEGRYTVPADGSVDRLRVLIGMLATASIAVGEYWFIDDVFLYGPAVPSVEGVDKLALTWKSLG